MATPIGDAVAAELGLTRAFTDLERLLQHVRHHQHYDDPDKPNAAERHGDPEEPAMSVLDDLKNILDKGEQDAAKVQRYEAEPLVSGVVDMIEAVPEARGILELVLAGIGKLAAMAPAPEAAPADHPTADPQVQTGIAV